MESPINNDSLIKDHEINNRVIGLGIMGSSIARHIARAGYRVAGYDVRPARLREINAAGGVAASSSSDVARQSRISDHIASFVGRARADG